MWGSKDVLKIIVLDLNVMEQIEWYYMFNLSCLFYKRQAGVLGKNCFYFFWQLNTCVHFVNNAADALWSAKKCKRIDDQESRCDGLLRLCTLKISLTTESKQYGRPLENIFDFVIIIVLCANTGKI